MAFFLKTPPPVRKMLIYRVLGRLSEGAIKGVKVAPDVFFGAEWGRLSGGE